jgi:hypothetical protein
MADKQDRHFTERPSGTVHVESCETEPDDNAWAGAWVDSHATYSFSG